MGAVGLALVFSGPEPLPVLVSALALLSTPAALLLAPSHRRLAALWLLVAATLYLLLGPRAARTTLAYSLPYSGAQAVAAVALLLRRPADAVPRAFAWPRVTAAGLALGCAGSIVALYHAFLGLSLVITFGREGGWARGWWMADVLSLLSTPPAVAVAWIVPRLAGGWLLAAAALGALAAVGAPNMEPSQWIRLLFFWLAPQLALGGAFLRNGRARGSRP